MALHMVWGALGMFLLLRRMGLGVLSSIFGALIFQSLPRTWSHLTAGHLTLVYAINWTPWLLWSELKQNSRGFLLPGIILAISALADIRWVIYVGMFWMGFRFWQSSPEILASTRNVRIWLVETARSILISLGLSAPLLIPLIEFTSISTRQELGYSENLIFSLLPQQFLGLIFPDVTGYVEFILYPGAVCVIAFLWSWLDGSLRKKTKLFRWGIIISFLLTLGENFTPTQWFLSLPGFDLLRVPSRFMVIAGVLFAILTAIWMEYILHCDQKSINIRAVRLGLAGISGLGVILIGAIWYVVGSVPANYLWGCLLYVILTVLLFIWIARIISLRITAYLLFVIALLDIYTLVNIQLVFRPTTEIMAQKQDAAVYLRSQSGLFRVYSPSYSMPQHIAAQNQLELADGIDPLQSKNYVDYFKIASGVAQSGYSVTVPAFKTGNPQIDNKDIVPDAELLGLLNVRYVVAAFPVESSHLEKVWEDENTKIYENKLFLPRTWIQDENSPVGSNIKSVTSIELSPNEIRMTAEGPGLLVLSENDYPGWNAYVNEKKTPIQASAIFRSVVLGEGQHNVVFRYQPLSLIVGFLAFILTVGIMIGLFLKRRIDGY